MDGKVVIGTEINTRNFDKQISYIESQMEDIDEKLEKADLGFDVGDTQKLEATYERLGIKLENLRKKQTKLNQEQMQMNRLDLTGVQSGISNVNKGLTQTIKKVTRWGLALFGIRSVYNAIRGAMNTLSQYDDKMATNIEYIHFALANTLKPLIEIILNLIVKLLQYINYIAKAWTGKNLFKGAEAFDKARKNAKGLNKELEKTTTSFDEMNILQKPSETEGITPTGIDLTGLTDGKVPDWLQWIVEHKDEILGVMAGVTAGLLAWKFGLSPIKSLGIGVAVAGIVYTIESLLDYLKDPSWENFGKIITGIGVAVAGVAIAFGAWPIAVAGAIIAVIGIIVSNWEKIKKFFQDGIDWLADKSEWVHKMFGDLLGGVYDSFVTILQNVLNIFDYTFNMLKGILDGIILFVKGVFTGNWKQAWDGIVKIFSSIFTGIVGIVTNVISIIWNIVKGITLTVAQVIVELFKTVVNGVLKTIESVLNAPIMTVNSLIGVINKVPGINLGKLPTFKLPRLAKGTILNNPGKGVPVASGNAIAGEAGREAYLPLSDTQLLEELGATIGRYITINANITNTMNGRVISRELQKVNNTNDFAFNR